MTTRPPEPGADPRARRPSGPEGDAAWAAMPGGNPMSSEETPWADPAHPICGARTRAGGRCQRRPMAHRRRCDLHGGKTPRGIASPHYKHGRFSQVAPARMLSAYEEVPQDPQLLATRDLAALSLARLQELLRQVDDGASRTGVRRLRHLARQYDRAAPDDRAAIWTQIRQVIDAAADDGATWREIDHVVQMFLKTAARERQRLLDLEALVTAEEAAAFGAAVIGVIRKHVTDRALLEAMQADLSVIYEARMRAE